MKKYITPCVILKELQEDVVTASVPTSNNFIVDKFDDLSNFTE